jgi:hypothetical protein
MVVAAEGGNFVGGQFIEAKPQSSNDVPNAETHPQEYLDYLAGIMIRAAAMHFDEWNKQHPPGSAVIWRQTASGLLVVTTPDPKYAKQLVRFIGRLK